jgi:cytochrome P450
MPFGGGIRACFGRKLAYLELRVLFTMIIWNFKLEPVVERYDSWAAVDAITHAPQECFVKLTELNGARE